MSAQADQLKARLKEREEAFDQQTRIRIHRAISWLRRAEAEPDDPDARFIFLWIAFNAAYGQDLGHESTEPELLTRFLSKLIDADKEGRLHALLFQKYSGSIRILIDNKFVFAPFWRALREHDSSERWKDRFQASQKAALHAVMSKDTLKVLGIVFDRLYVLRNQLVHGGATWASRVNRAQVGDGCSILGDLVPLMIQSMLEKPDSDWGEVAYPVI